MGMLITAVRNGVLEKALLHSEAGKAYKKMDRWMYKAVVGALKKARMDAEEAKRRQQIRNKARKYRPGCQEGRIGVYGPTSSPMGQLAKGIQIY